jgi:hypothetical protein
MKEREREREREQGRRLKRDQPSRVGLAPFLWLLSIPDAVAFVPPLNGHHDPNGIHSIRNILWNPI